MQNDLSYFAKSASIQSTSNTPDTRHGKVKSSKKAKAKAAVSVTNSPEIPGQLLTPTEAKIKPRPKPSNSPEMPTQSIGSPAGSSSSAQKRVHEQEKSDATTKKAKLSNQTQQQTTQQPPIAGSSSNPMKRRIEKDHPPRPAPPTNINKEAQKRSELKKFKERRDKQANNLFIKR